MGCRQWCVGGDDDIREKQEAETNQTNLAIFVHWNLMSTVNHEIGPISPKEWLLQNCAIVAAYLGESIMEYIMLF